MFSYQKKKNLFLNGHISLLVLFCSNTAVSYCSYNVYSFRCLIILLRKDKNKLSLTKNITYTIIYKSIYFSYANETTKHKTDHSRSTKACSIVVLIMLSLCYKTDIMHILFYHNSYPFYYEYVHRNRGVCLTYYPKYTPTLHT